MARNAPWGEPKLLAVGGGQNKWPLTVGLEHLDPQSLRIARKGNTGKGNGGDARVPIV